MRRRQNRLVQNTQRYGIHYQKFINQKQYGRKDGDIVYAESNTEYPSAIFIYYAKYKAISYACLYLNEQNTCNQKCYTYVGNMKLRYATEKEKQQLFDALAKKGKRWNPVTKQIEDLPKKCEFKSMDWCLMKDSTKYWKLCQFAYTKKVHGTTIYSAVGGLIYYKCIPYNDQTKHLLGTTDEWKGGEG